MVMEHGEIDLNSWIKQKRASEGGIDRNVMRLLWQQMLTARRRAMGAREGRGRAGEVAQVGRPRSHGLIPASAFTLLPPHSFHPPRP